MSSRISSIARPKHLLCRALKNTWAKTGILLILTILIYRSVMQQLFHSWLNNHYYYHGFIIPLISAYLIFRSRKKLINTEIAPSLYGVFVAFFGVVVFLLASYHEASFLSSLSMLVFLIGGVLFLFGKKFLNILLFPVLFLIFMIPIPNSVFTSLIGPLQLTAANLGEIILQFLGISVSRKGIYLNLEPISIEVGKSCSAMHSLIALSALSVIVAYLMLNSIGKRTIIVASSIPLAILANGFRLVLLILLVIWQGEKALDSFFHPLSGKLFFLGALSILVLEASILKRFGRLRIKDYCTRRLTPAKQGYGSRYPFPFPYSRYSKKQVISGETLTKKKENYGKSSRCRSRSLGKESCEEF